MLLPPTCMIDISGFEFLNVVSRSAEVLPLLHQETIL